MSLAETAYSLATLASAEVVTEQPCALRGGLARRVKVTRLPDATSALARVAAASRLTVQMEAGVATTQRYDPQMRLLLQ